MDHYFWFALKSVPLVGNVTFCRLLHHFQSPEEVFKAAPEELATVRGISPAVVAQIPDDSLLVAELSESVQNGARFKSVRFSCLSDTWRQKAPEQPPAVTKGKLMSYLNPIEPEESAPYYGTAQKKTKGVKRRVIDRSDLQQMSLLYAAEPK